MIKQIKYYILLVLLPFIYNHSIYGQSFRTMPLSPDIYTIQVNLNGDWNRRPVLNLKSDEYIHISFDRISDESFDRLRYRIIHCDASWNMTKDISEIDYLDGFNDNLIDDYSASINTTVSYTHFSLRVPNKDVSFRLSGNYVLQVYEETNEDNVLLYACFSVLDPLLNVAVGASSNTDIDTNRKHQQVSLSLMHPRLNIKDPFEDLKIYVKQNNRLDNMRRVSKPSTISSGKLIYEHLRELIFEATNEYRRFDIPSYRYNGLNVEHIEYNRPNYAMFIIPDKPKLNAYRYDQDQNGRFYIRNADAQDSAIEADYFYTHFTIPMDNPLLENVYINGDFTNNTFSDKYKLKYDYNTHEYKLSLLLKQGLYNYQYLSQVSKNLSTSAIDGNYYEAENEYSAFVYYRPAGQRYDSLIGYSAIQSRKK